MALNFPNSPTEGEVHTDEGIIWVYTGGRWIIRAEAVLDSEFHDPANVASWRIIGNTLECWGQGANVGDPYTTVTLPKTYASAGYVISLAITGSDSLARAFNPMVRETGKTASAFIFEQRRSTTESGTNRPFNWHTIGQWDGIS